MYLDKLKELVPEPHVQRMLENLAKSAHEALAEITVEAYYRGQWRQLAYGIAKLMAYQDFTYQNAYEMLAYETPTSFWLTKETMRLYANLMEEKQSADPEA